MHVSVGPCGIYAAREIAANGQILKGSKFNSKRIEISGSIWDR